MEREHEEAARIADEAGRALLAVRAAGGYRTAAELGRAADAEAQRIIASRLAERFPHDSVLSEEARDDRSRLTARRVWIVDPLDGTREFTEPGRADWAVHVAFWEQGGLRAGAVALPAIGVTLSTAFPPSPTPVTGRRRRVLASRSRPPAVAERVAQALDADLVPMGSAGAKAMAVVRGEADAYVHAGGQHEWDSAAPVAVASAGGFHASRLDGAPLRYNRPDPYLPDLVVCRPELAAAVLAATRPSDA